MHAQCIHSAYTLDSTTNVATLTIRDVPEATARNLKARAERNHRSLQREMLLILEESISSSVISEPQPQYRRYIYQG